MRAAKPKCDFCNHVKERHVLYQPEGFKVCMNNTCPCENYTEKREAA